MEPIPVVSLRYKKSTCSWINYEFEESMDEAFFGFIYRAYLQQLNSTRKIHKQLMITREIEIHFWVRVAWKSVTANGYHELNGVTMNPITNRQPF